MGTEEAACSFRLRGLTAKLDGLSTTEEDEFTFTLAGSSVDIERSAGESTFESGYGILDCTNPVEALVSYSSFDSTSQKTAEAAVFSAEEVRTVAFYADQTDGSRLGVAIANDTDLPADYTITRRFCWRNSRSHSHSRGAERSCQIPRRTRYRSSGPVRRAGNDSGS